MVVGDHVYLGGLCAIHQFVRIGEHAIVGGMTGVVRDVIPFGAVAGDRGRLRGLNIVGLRRRGYARQSIASLRAAYQLLFYSGGDLAMRLERVESEFRGDENVARIVAFASQKSRRGLLHPSVRGEDSSAEGDDL